jgi:hypothetical protein
MMIIPTWAILGLVAAFLAALQPLVQEKYKINPFALAFGVKAVMAALMLPVIMVQGLPTDMNFYIGIAVMAGVWCISDVMYYRAVQTVGAGPVSRVLPGVAVISFVVWFFFRPELLDEYMAKPAVAAGVTACILAATFFATRLTRCEVSRATIRLLWFTMLAATVDPITTKLILGTAGNAQQAPYAYVFVEAVIMLAIWSTYLAIRRPPAITLQLFRSSAVVQAALLAGVISAIRLVLQNMAYVEVEHPAYLRVLMFTDALWIIVIYKLVGRRETSNVLAGLGIVAAAAGLVLLKSL